MRLTLRTLLAYRTRQLTPEQMRQMRDKVKQSDLAQSMVAHIQHVLAQPPSNSHRGTDANVVGSDEGDLFDAHLVAGYLSDDLSPEEVAEVEMRCMVNDVQLEEIVACSEVLADVFSKSVRIKSAARRRVIHKIQPYLEPSAVARPPPLPKPNSVLGETHQPAHPSQPPAE